MIKKMGGNQANLDMNTAALSWISESIDTNKNNF
jgi:hypothetical protein